MNGTALVVVLAAFGFGAHHCLGAASRAHRLSWRSRSHVVVKPLPYDWSKEMS